MKQKTLREDAHSREAETCRKRLRETPECAKAHSFSYRTEMRVTYMKRLAVGILAHVDAGKTHMNWRKSAESRFFPSRRGLHGMIWM